MDEETAEEEKRRQEEEERERTEGTTEGRLKRGRGAGARKENMGVEEEERGRE